MASITLDHLNKWFGPSVHAVQDVNIHIEDGEFFGLLGPSGSGKTSVLRMLVGLERPTEGQILFDGVPVQDKTPQERNVAMVFEQNALYPHMTARQNISYPLRVRKASRESIAHKVAEVAALLNIGALLDRRASQMSGGQQQRVAIARALVRDPNLLCLDEPIAHLDTLLRARLRGELKRLQRALGTTSVIVTHDPIEAMTMTDRLAVMRDGVLQQVGSADEIHNRPVNAFVAQFFGLHSMNVLTVESCVDQGSHIAGRLGGEPARLPQTVERFFGGSRRTASIGARPSGVIALRANEPIPPVDGFTAAGHVYVTEQLGDAQLVTVQIGDQSIQCLTPDLYPFEIDEPVRIFIPDDILFLFDNDTHVTSRFASRSPLDEVKAARVSAA
ncbi:ABC transporter ATP-binding protein [Acidisoma cellulosilytica]|uniref:ABC transporter ATP-binding protein n=1 Tax=Acidisoma cellulosilyticum TaxID=2802395 RepID=A0A964E5J8_9PROT|nr:ABC transporter ATP-binding protein [Acidisoma cellulosilyticum]MCB8882599.1 ABC transporter ATP-binding protein [Acidisoma cellulosilyticum]